MKSVNAWDHELLGQGPSSAWNPGFRREGNFPNDSEEQFWLSDWRWHSSLDMCSNRCCFNIEIIGLLPRLCLVPYICSAVSKLHASYLSASKEIFTFSLPINNKITFQKFIIQLTYSCNHNVTRVQYFASNAYIKPNARCPVQCSYTPDKGFWSLQENLKSFLASSPAGSAQQAWCE